MKGLDPLIAFVLIIAISISAVSLALSIGKPAIEKSKEILLFTEGRENLKVIDSTINQVLQEGDGSSRKIAIAVGDGNYNISGNKIEFKMQTIYNIYSNETGKEDNMFLSGSNGEIVAYIQYNFNFIGEKRLIKGMNTLVISNQAGSIKVE